MHTINLLIVSILIGSATALAQLPGRVPLKQRYPMGIVKVVFDGDSLTAQTSAPADPGGIPNVSQYWAYKHHGVTITNFATWNQRSDQMLADVTTQIFPHLVSTKTNVVVALIGVNDWNDGSITTNTAWVNYSNYLWQVKNFGVTSGVPVRVVACTIHDSRLDGEIGKEVAFRTNYNALIRQHFSAAAHVLCDVGADVRFGNSDDATYFFPDDRVHLSETGIRLTADFFDEAIIKAAFGGL